MKSKLFSAYLIARLFALLIKWRKFGIGPCASRDLHNYLTARGAVIAYRNQFTINSRRNRFWFSLFGAIFLDQCLALPWSAWSSGEKRVNCNREWKEYFFLKKEKSNWINNFIYFFIYSMCFCFLFYFAFYNSTYNYSTRVITRILYERLHAVFNMPQ